LPLEAGVDRGRNHTLNRGTLCPVVVGRNDELAALSEAIERAFEGHGGVILLIGEAGIGKSRLARETQAIARSRGLAVLSGRAVQQVAATPYRALTEALFGALRGGPIPDAPELRPFRSALGRIVPGWETEEPAGDISSVILGEAMLRLLRLLAGDRGCVLVLEDLHWADLDTLSIVEYLSDNLYEQPILCVATVRSDEPSAASSLMQRLQSRRAVTVMELSRLDRVETRRMATACLSDQVAPPDLIEGVYERSEGLPLLIEELLPLFQTIDSAEADRVGFVEERVPRAFAQIIESRIGGLDARSRAVIEGAAVLGRSFDWTLLPTLTGLDETMVLAALDVACRLQLMVSEPLTRGPTFRFRHALMRDAILGGLLASRRVDLAQKAAEAIESSHFDDDGRLLAAQLRAIAGDQVGAARHLLEAGRAAVSRGALATAESALRRAKTLAITDVTLLADIDETLLLALALAAKTDLALQVGEALLDRLGVLRAPPEQRARVHIAIGRACDAATRWLPAEEHLEKAAKLAEESGRDDLLAAVQALAAHVAMGDDRIDEATALARSVLETAEPLDEPETTCEALEIIGRRERLHNRKRATAAFERMMQIAQDSGLEIWAIRAMHELGIIEAFETSRLQRLTEARDRAYDAGALALGATIDLQLTGMRGYLFEPDAALESGARCVELARSLGWDAVLLTGLVQCAFAQAIAGRRDDMEELVAETIGRFGERPDVMAMVLGHCRSTYSLLAENRDEARFELDEGMSLLRRSTGVPPFAFPALWALVKTVDDTDGDAARKEVREMEATSLPLSKSLMHIADAVALGRRDRREDASATFTSADNALRRIRMEGMRNLARRLAAEAALKDGWGLPVDWLSEATLYFESSGHRSVAIACRSLLRAAGAPTPRRGHAQPALPAELADLKLTVREIEILDLLSERLSNKAIAERLYISHRTVEKHVERLLAKSGTKSRAELAGLAHRARVSASH
jgi:predicted ATPase/DNA-binding CsgD family transcriptional regulator